MMQNQGKFKGSGEVVVSKRVMGMLLGREGQFTEAFHVKLIDSQDWVNAGREREIGASFPLWPPSLIQWPKPVLPKSKLRQCRVGCLWKHL